MSVNYEHKIPAVLEHFGVLYPPTTLDPDDCTLKDQVIDLLDMADQHYAEAIAGTDADPAFLLIDAIKILNGAIEKLDVAKLKREA
tara:strand:- start:309 stop:566 length:258 start_codon:yes stop_codon:yes gene_type:complete